jgi:hypothetical protein
VTEPRQGREAPGSPDAEDREPAVADTDKPMTWREMAAAWGAIAKPTTAEDVELSVDPDDYPPF